MRNKLVYVIGGVVVALLAAQPAEVRGQVGSDSPNQVRAARRSALLMARSNLRPTPRATTSVVGSIWSPEEEGVPNVAVRLRDLVAGEVAAVTRTDESGSFVFDQVERGTYLVEVAEEEDGAPIAFGDVITLAAEETVVVFVKLPRPLGWTSTLAALLGAPGGAAGAGAGAGGAAVGSTVGSAVGSSVGSAVGTAVGSVGSSVAGTFGSAVASVVSSAAGAGVTGIGGGRSASNEDQAR